MATAGELAERARFATPPNPWVGCVIVRDGEIVGRGATGPYPGGLHAEAAAVLDAGDRARGATAYVTLEPCNHHGNTPPCTEALIDAGVARVVVALEDPDPRVRGTGVARLRAAGIDVDARRRRRRGRAVPGAVPPPARDRSGLRAAQDRDEPRRPDRRGRRQLAVDHRGRSARRRAPAARRVPGRGGRSRHRACRSAATHGPRAATTSSPASRCGSCSTRAGRVAADGPLFDLDARADARHHHRAGAGERRRRLAGRGREGRDGRCRAARVAAWTSSRCSRCWPRRHGVLQAMVEGGGRLHGAFVDENLADRLVAYVAPGAAR